MPGGRVCSSGVRAIARHPNIAPVTPPGIPFACSLALAASHSSASHPPYEHSALPSSLSPRVHQRPHVHQSPVPTELSRLSRSAGCVWQAGHLARHRFNITDVFFAFQPLSYYPLFPPPITLSVIWTLTTSFQLYLLQKLNFVLKKKTPPPSPWQFHRKKWSFFSLSIKQP